MKIIKINILAALLITLIFSVRAEAKWWIFGQSNEEVSITYMYLNKISYDESGPKVTLYKETLPDGRIFINGKASVRKGKIGGVRVTVNNKETWEEAKLSENGAFEFSFNPEQGKLYTLYVEIIDTAGKTNDIESTRKEVVISGQNIMAVIKEVLDRMIEAYRNEDPGRFMSFVSEDFAGDATNLDRAIRKDFSSFDNIDLRYTINNVASGSKGMVYVSINFNRSVISARDGKTYTDKGMTELVFQLGSARVYSMKNPLIFGLSDPEEVATGAVNSPLNKDNIGFEPNGNVKLCDGGSCGDAASTIETGTNISIVTEAHPPAGFDIASGEVMVGHLGDFTITGGDDAGPTPYAYGFLKAGVTIVNLGAVGINTVNEAPAGGYTDPGGINFYVGNTYAFKLGSGKYALVEVKSVILTWVPEVLPALGHFRYTVRIDYKYQTDGTRNF